MKLKPNLLKTLAACAAALCAGTAAPAWAQDVWIGRPTGADYFRHHLAQAIQHQQQAVRSKAQFNAELEQARRDFFASAPQSAKRAAAEKRFAEMLLGKDYIYMTLLLTEGTGEQSRKRSDLMHGITGGHIDGGIPQAARPAFDAWVNAVRTNLGARSPNQVLFVADAGRLQRAIEGSGESYAGYKQLRDQFEFDRFNTAKAAVESRVAGGGHSLHKSSQVPLDVTRDMPPGLRHNAPLLSRLNELAKAGQPVLRCAYGPLEIRADGTPRYEYRLFWFKQAPEGIDDLIAADTNNGMEQLRTRSALAACPPTSVQARAAFGPAGARHGATAPSGATPGASRNLEELAAAAEQQRREREAEREQAAAQQQAQRVRAEAQLEAQREAAAARQQAQRDAHQQRQCAAIDAQIERLRGQMQAMPPVHAARREPQLQAMERSRAERCGG